MARGWNFLDLQRRGIVLYPCSENKDMISFEVTAKLICAFVFAYADCWFSHAVAQIIVNWAPVQTFQSDSTYLRTPKFRASEILHNWPVGRALNSKSRGPWALCYVIDRVATRRGNSTDKAAECYDVRR